MLEVVRFLAVLLVVLVVHDSGCSVDKVRSRWVVVFVGREQAVLVVVAAACTSLFVLQPVAEQRLLLFVAALAFPGVERAVLAGIEVFVPFLLGAVQFEPCFGG